MMFQKSDRLARAVFTVAPHAVGWAVEHEGEVFDPCRTKDEAQAAATRRARAAQEAGRPSQVTVKGERGYFSGRPRPTAA
jgi:hypothetical protein